MHVSVFDLFKVGVGPSSSHTMGPMIAAERFARSLAELYRSPARIVATLYASLALTGRGHGTDRAVMLGLSGQRPDTLDPDAADCLLDQIRLSQRITLPDGKPLRFDLSRDIVWAGRTRLPQHPNALRFSALDSAGQELHSQLYFSVGGGFLIEEGQNCASAEDGNCTVPFTFESGEELLSQAAEAQCSIAELMERNELALRTREEVLAGLDAIVLAMDACIDRGLRREGLLPGSLKVRRRAKGILEQLEDRVSGDRPDPCHGMDWVNLWAMAVNEENASGGRVVTAPTNGAAGIIPAVMRYHAHFFAGTLDDKRRFLLTAAAIGGLYKRNASISGAEVGCQGEIGVACSMAAAGLAAVMGGTNAQVENAAEIAMEHNLGLTCDPIGGLVQIPCIERNAMGAVKAIDAARLALLGNGLHTVSLDSVIRTMLRTGSDMHEIYKETSLGGLALEVGSTVNWVEC